MSNTSEPLPAPRRTSYRALAEAVRLAVRADYRYVIDRGSKLDMLLARLEEAAKALERMEPGTSIDGFERLGDVARRVVGGLETRK